MISSPFDRPSGARARYVRVAAAAAAIALAAVPAIARPLTLSTAPAAPLWQEPVTLTVSGLGCQPRLGPFSFVGSPQLTLEASLLEDCAGQVPAPFVVAAQVDLPGPGKFTLRVRDRDQTFVAIPLTAYEPGTVGVELPPVVYAGELVKAVLTFRAGCAFVGHEVHGNVVEIEIHNECVFPIPMPALRVHRFEVPLGVLDEGRYEVRVLDYTSWQLQPGMVRRSLLVARPGSCLPDAATLCLHDSRFSVTGTWRDFSQRTGVLQARPLPGNEESGLAWFFDPGNVELTIKILDGCVVNDRYWVFVSSGSTVQYALTVTDTHTGRSRTYGNALGATPQLLADVDALESCS